MRTSQEALRDAIDSGAVDAWIAGEPIEFQYVDLEEGWEPYKGEGPGFHREGIVWRQPKKMHYSPVFKTEDGHPFLSGSYERLEDAEEKNFPTSFAAEKTKWVGIFVWEDPF